MRSETKMLSFRPVNDEIETRKCSKIRKNLHQTFMNDNEITSSGDNMEAKDIANRETKCIGSNVLSRVNLSNSKKAITSGAEKIGRTFRRVGSTFGRMTRHFRGSHRRQRLAENATPCHTPATPQARCKQLLGRTPTKLYSPFGIETPRFLTDRDHPINPDTPDHIASPHKKQRKCALSWKFMKRHPRSFF